MKDLTKYNYDELVDYITDEYEDKVGSGNGFQGSTGQMLIELLADVTDNLHFMLERRSQESFVNLARLESSVWMAASGVGYVPRRNVSARGTLLLTLKDIDDNTIPAEYDIFIRKGEVVKFGDEAFIVAEDAKIDAGETSTEIDILEGISRQAAFNFNTEPYKTDNFITLENYPQIEEFSLVVTETGGDQYTYVNETDVTGVRFSALSFVPEDFPAYDIRFSREGMRIVFGEGNFGRKPSNEITVRWIESRGDEVSIIQTGLDFELSTKTIEDSRTTLPSKSYFYSLTNSTTIDGGAGFESMEEIRENLSAHIRSNNRAVTNFDHEYWVRRSGIGDVADVKVYGEQEMNRLIFNMNNAYISYITNSGNPINSAQEKLLREYLDRVKVITTHLVFQQAEKVYLGLDIDFKRHPSLPITDGQLYRVLVDKVNDYFKIEKGSIGKEFQHSEFIEYLQNLTFEFNSVLYQMTDFVKVEVTGMTPFSYPHQVYDGIIELASDYPLKPNESWEIFIDGESMAVFSSAGDTVNSMVTKMKEEIFRKTSLMIAQPEDNQIRVTHPSNTGTYGISMGDSDLSSGTTFNSNIKIPRFTNIYNANQNLVMPSSVGVVSDDGTVIMEDDGDGTLIDSTGTYADAEIDYAHSYISTPVIPEGEYYITFQQNDFQNFGVTNDYVIVNMPFAPATDDGEYYFSRITLR